MGLQFVLNNTLPISDSTQLDLPPDDLSIDLTGIRSHWGVFEKYTVTATAKKNRFIKSVLVGHGNQETPPALYLQDRQRPLIIVGRAAIKGEAYLPKQGIRPGNISGNAFYGNTLVQGRQRESKEQLPQLHPGMKTYLNGLLKNRSAIPITERIRSVNGIKAENSFQQPTKWLSGTVVDLSGASLRGNIVVRASQRIIVDASSQLQDVLLVAPTIIIKNRSTGIFQALASRQIEVGKNCNLGYPSALITIKDRNAPKNGNRMQPPAIHLDQGSEISGIVLYLEEKQEETAFYPQVKLEKNSRVRGEVYCERNLEHLGQVFGTVYTSGFIALENGSIYQNHLYNGTIENEAHPPQYSGLPILGKKQRKTVSKWLY